MKMRLEELSKINIDLKSLLNNKDILDIIIFGSFAKGKANFNDIDIAILSEKSIDFKKEGYHVSKIKPLDFFINTPSIVNTLIREGYSLKNKKSFSELWKFSNGCLFTYDLKGLSNSKKVITVRLLRGIKKEKGMVENLNGKWLANNIFTCPINQEHVFQKFFEGKSIKFNKSYILIH